MARIDPQRAPMASPSSSQLPHRLSTRRGSASACDPFNANANFNHHPDRTSSSTLTIVRLPPAQSSPTPPYEPPASPPFGQRRHRRPGSGTTSTPQTPQTPVEPSPQPQPSRLSFAFSSFSGAGTSPGSPSARDSQDRIPSPSSSPRIRSLSPRQSTSGQFSSKPRLSPEELVDLARLSINPRAVVAAPVPSAIAPNSPPRSPIRSQAQPSPATFTPLPVDIYLPFIDRPSEVTSLISSPPDAKLFALLAQTIGSKQDAGTLAPLEQPSDLPTDPAEWSYHHLAFHLTKLDRDVAPDTIWAYAVRKCVISRSESIWERVKGALGIPPELDIDWDFNHRNDGNSDSDSIRTEDISDDEGRAARGHWSDWDATMDSPIFDKRVNRLSGESVFSPTPPEVEPENQIIIEQITSTPPSFSTVPPPLSLPSSLSPNIPSDGLGDIAEGAEDEEEEGGAQSMNKASLVGLSSTQSDLTTVSQVLGLKISTAPIPMRRETPPVMSPSSPPIISAKATAIPGTNRGPSYMGSLPHSRSNSFSCIGPFRRAELKDSMSASLSNSRMIHPSGGSDAGDTASTLSELHLGDWVSESRAAGVPLFPSNFARLTGSPTLNRSNSKNSLRSRAHSHGASSLSGSILETQNRGTAPSSGPGTGGDKGLII
ncbi:hypothetical protein AGABI1DRAFT_105179 [Agaricus bisporus var. burnettii JB137-S8]|uniref:Uncharacterized protein n=1 Tax=Agaricus bisporus var. burnettii (strain JB137-S8 / ATCC MYA-4627 / FGSC 10392) TaxID=597362 RepID=K5XER3_AGABU|nr:uncharacterized protein AGABI1DRAFT_105179 [Agaricus bisporus var. burnettii JB137-S8]EKM81672.1 hypothetical protein AGABI1DRAFT_105179 [Agaricus bisporus var. burnettii JB137-S8]